MAIDMTQFYQVFFEESAEHLANMEALLLDLDVSDPDSEQLNAIFRAAHSIKGSAGTFGFSDLADTTHILENLLDKIRKEELRLRSEMIDAFLETGDLLQGMLEAHQGRGEVDQDAVDAICNRLKALSAEEDSSPQVIAAAPVAHVAEVAVTASPSMTVTPVSATRKAYDIQFIPTEASVKSEGVQSLLDELSGYGELSILKQPSLPVNQGGGYWELRLVTCEPQDKFADQIDFVAESGAWRVEEDMAYLPGQEDAFGFFLESPGVPDAQLGYGFFEQIPESTVVPSLSDRPDEQAAYGFFTDPPVASEIESVSCAAVDDPGYGFFDEPIVGTATTIALAPPSGEEGEGFGFFVPLPLVNANDSRAETSAPPVGDGRLAPVSGQLPAKLEQGGAASSAPDKKMAEAKSSKSAISSAAASGDSSIRVSVEKVDQLINLVGELVITQAMLLQTATLMPDGAPEGLVNGLAQLERNTRDLQESVMSIRMMPISFVFSRFPRVVRDLSSKLGKQVELKTSGETTELDKSLIEKIVDPLTHLIRNSLDHGIEDPEKRIAAGKNPVGTITLKAYHQGGNIVIEVGDDGAGLQRNRILAKARERGMQVSDQMTDQEVFNLIFEAGFSTADQITDVSGRGVGMDVVRRNIQSMGGRVEIDSMTGVGTRMTVRLPLTLAILDGMSVAVGDQTYILPLSYVIESVQPEIGDIKTLSNHARVIQVRGEYLPVVVLHEVFGLKSQWKNLTQGIMVVLEADGTKAALFVDALVGQHQVVIKSLEANYRRVPGISGATIMGDGHVALILDVSAIAGMARSNMQKAA